ncbi:hypothetical protein MKW92_024599, partial [Papaver armeniacum]
KKKKCSRKVKSDVHVDQTLLDATVEDRRVVSTDGCLFTPLSPAYTCKVTTYSSPKVLKRVRNSLSPAEQEKFMSTAIGPLSHLPMQTWSRRLISFLIGYNWKTFEDITFWQKGEGRKKSRKSGKKEEEKKSRECHQSSNSNAECEIVKVPLESEDKVKLSLLYVVHGYVLGKGNDKVVECDHWYLVDNLVDFNSYPWAEIAFNITLVKSNAALAYQIKHEKPVGSEVTYKCQGMAHVLVVRNKLGLIFSSLGPEVLPKLRSRFGNKTIFANWRPHMHSVTCDSVITHESLLKVLEESKGEVCDDIMWHKEDAKRLVMLGLCEGPLVDDEQEDSLKNENVVEKEDLFEKGEEENMLESKNVFVDEQSSGGEQSMDDEKDEEDLVRECKYGHQLRVIASFESFVKNAMIGHTEDLKKTKIGEMEVFKTSSVSNDHKTMLDRMECLTTEIKSIKDKIGGTQTYIALSKKKTGTPPGGHNEEGDFDGAAMQKPDVTPRQWIQQD